MPYRADAFVCFKYLKGIPLVEGFKEFLSLWPLFISPDVLPIPNSLVAKTR